MMAAGQRRQLVLTVIGDDRAGLVSALATVVASHGGNWEQSQMAELDGKFAGIVAVSVADDRADALIDALRPLDGLLDVTVHHGDTRQDGAAGREFHLELVGGDRPGIVAEISAVLARHGINVGRLNTTTSEAPMSGERLFHASAVLAAPDGVDLDAVQRELEQLANELMVDLNFGRPS